MAVLVTTNLYIIILIMSKLRFFKGRGPKLTPKYSSRKKGHPFCENPIEAPVQSLQYPRVTAGEQWGGPRSFLTFYLH